MSEAGNQIALKREITEEDKQFIALLVEMVWHYIRMTQNPIKGAVEMKIDEDLLAYDFQISPEIDKRQNSAIWRLMKYYVPFNNTTKLAELNQDEIFVQIIIYLRNNGHCLTVNFEAAINSFLTHERRQGTEEFHPQLYEYAKNYMLSEIACNIRNVLRSLPDWSSYFKELLKSYMEADGVEVNEKSETAIKFVAPLHETLPPLNQVSESTAVPGLVSK